jgi:hypothetical protein
MKEAPKPSAIIVGKDDSHLKDFFIFEVKMIVSIPNYYCDDHEKEAEFASPIDEMLQALGDTEVNVMGWTSSRLDLIPAKKAIS